MGGADGARAAGQGREAEHIRRRSSLLDVLSQFHLREPPQLNLQSDLQSRVALE